VVLPDAEVPSDVRAALVALAGSVEFRVLGIALAPRATLSTGGSVADAMAEAEPWFHALVTGDGGELARKLRQHGFPRAVAASMAWVAIRPVDRAMEPPPMGVTDSANVGSAPSASAAHLSR